MATKVFIKLITVQSKLRAPKDCRNEFGKYNYRKAEDILEAVKPLLREVGAIVLIDDDVQQIGDRFYVKATASFVDVEDGMTVSASALAREALDKKGMDSAQVTGATSSYARKYALNGLFAIDDSSQDPDVTNKHENATQSAPGKAVAQPAATKAPVAPAPVPAASPAKPAPSTAKKSSSPLAREAWAAFRTLGLTKRMSDAQRNESFKNLLKEQCGKVATADLTDDDWNKVIEHISTLACI